MLRRAIPDHLDVSSHTGPSPCLMKICITHIFVNMNYSNTLLPFEMILPNRALISIKAYWMFWGRKQANCRNWQFGNEILY